MVRVSVPQYTSNVRARGVNQQNISVNASPDAFGASIGNAIQGASRGITSAAEALDYRDALKAEADARQAANEYRGVVRSGLYDPNTGYLVQSGANAINGQRQSTFENLAEARSDIVGRLSPRAQKSFEQFADGLDNSAQDSAIRHEGVEFKGFTLQSFEASAQGFLDDALINAADDNKFGQNMQAAEAELRRAAALQGTSPEALDQQVAALRSSGQAGRVIEMARQDPVAAYNYLQENQDSISRDEFNRLHEGLEPAYYAAGARNWVSGQNATHVAAGHADEDQYGVPFWISGPESGGDSNAANPLSSARGRVQFIDGTYLSYVNRLQPSWAQGLTEQEILETRRDPAKEGEIYRAFRADNQNALRSAGHQVTPRSEYMAHHMGPEIANAMLNAERNGGLGGSLRDLLNANGVNAQQWMDANPWMRGKTVAGALGWFANKTGGRGQQGLGATPSNTVSNPALLMAEAVNIEDPQLRAATIRELQLRISAEETVRGETTRLASEEAWKIVDEGGSPSDIPPNLQAEIGINGMNEIFNSYERNQTGVDFTDETRHLELLDLARDNPTDFAALDLNEDRANLSRGDLLALRDLQSDIGGSLKVTNEQGSAALVYTDADYRTAMNDASEQYHAAAGVTPGSQMTQEQMAQYNRFTQQLRSGMSAFANEHGRQMSFEERTNMVNTLLAPVVIDGVDLHSGFGKGTFLSDVPLLAREGFEMQLEREDVPPSEERRIRDSLSRSFGREASEDEIVEQWENELLMSMGISPVIEYSEIPRDIRRMINDQYPGASREEVTDAFLALSMRAALDARGE